MENSEFYRWSPGVPIKCINVTRPLRHGFASCLPKRARQEAPIPESAPGGEGRLYVLEIGAQGVVKYKCTPIFCGVFMKHVEIYTDGSCRKNPGPGGWGAILVYRGKEKELSGGEPETTNNRMELTAVISALSALKEPCEVTLTSDSKYVCDAVTLGWAKDWRRKGWKKADKKPALNPDLWEALLDLLEIHKVTFVWVKGHAGHPYNERCDAMAQAESGRFAADGEEK